MFDMYLASISIYKFKRHSKLHLAFIKNLLTFSSRYHGKFCNFYPHLNFVVVLPALRLTQILCINIKNSFLENWQFNHKLALPLLCTYQAWKTILTIWQNMKVTGNQKTLIFQLFRNLRKNLEVHTKLTFRNPNFPFIPWIGENWDVQLEQHSKIPIFNLFMS